LAHFVHHGFSHIGASVWARPPRHTALAIEPGCRGWSCHAHTGQDFVIEAFQTALALFDQLRLEAALPITRHLNFKMPLLAFQRFLALQIACIAADVPLASMFWVAQVRVEFRFQATFQLCPGQFFEQATFSQDVLGILVLFEQFINQFGPNSHAVFLFSCSHVFPL
jgi:hypothetical protein